MKKNPMSIETQKKLHILLQEMGNLRNKAMKSLQEGNLQKSSLLFNLQARNSDKVSDLLKEEFKKQEEE